MLPATSGARTPPVFSNSASTLYVSRTASATRWYGAASSPRLLKSAVARPTTSPYRAAIGCQVLVDHRRHSRLGRQVRGNRDEPRPVAAHAPGARAVLLEEQVQPSEFASPLERLDDDCAIHVVLLQVVAAPDQLADRHARVRMPADDHVDARHLGGELHVGPLAGMGEEHDDVGLRAQRLDHALRRGDFVEDVDAFLGRGIRGGFPRDEPEEPHPQAADLLDAPRLLRAACFVARSTALARRTGCFVRRRSFCNWASGWLNS